MVEALEVVRVTEITEYILRESQGVKKLFPPKLFTEKYPRVSYPYSVSKADPLTGRSHHPDFGRGIEALVVAWLDFYYKDQFVCLGNDGTYCKKDLLRFRKDPGELFPYFSDKDWNRWCDEIVSSAKNTAKEILEAFGKESILSIDYGNEFFTKYRINEREGYELQGHPDLLVRYKTNPGKVPRVCPLDVKVFHVSSGMSPETRNIKVQLALYVRLSRLNNYQVEQVGIVMPWQRDPKLKLYDLGKWDCNVIGEMIFPAIKKVLFSRNVARAWWKKIHEENLHIGKHHTKSDVGLLLDPSFKRPFQIFLLGNRGTAKNEDQKLKALMDSYGERAMAKKHAYVHAPYFISLSRDMISSNGTARTIDAAIKYMKCAIFMSFSGVVFHVDKCPADWEEARSNLISNIQELLPYASEQTPILLENPCGDGTGFLSSPNDMKELFEEIDPDGKDPRIGICLDTCHSWVAGHSPYSKYIRDLDTVHRRIKLIHFNGSWKHKGSKVDGHSSMHKHQTIPLEELEKIVYYARDRGLKCIVE